MKRWTIFCGLFLFGLITGLGLVQFWPEASQSEAVAEGPVLARNHIASEAMLLDRIREKDAEIARLKADLEQAVSYSPEIVEEEQLEEVPPATDLREDRRARFMERVEERISQRSESMADKYGLTEAQSEELNGIFMRQFESFRGRRRGEVTEPFSLDDAIGKVMTDEQFEEYLKDSQQDIFDRAELVATTQLVRMNQRMDLAPEVQDDVYEAIHYTAQEMMIARQTGDAYDMEGAISERLGSILSEEQLQVYLETARRRPGPRPGP